MSAFFPFPERVSSISFYLLGAISSSISKGYLAKLDAFGESYYSLAKHTQQNTN